MSVNPANGVAAQIAELSRRLAALEAAKIDVVSDRVGRLSRDVDDFREQVRGEMKTVREHVSSETSSLRRAFYTFILGTLTAVIVLVVAQVLAA